jgi:hypothetical protein
MLKRTVPYFWRTGTFWYVLRLLFSLTVPAYRTVLLRTLVRWGQRVAKAYLTVPERTGHGRLHPPYGGAVRFGTVGYARELGPVRTGWVKLAKKIEIL